MTLRVDNHGKKTWSKLNFQLYIALEKLITNKDADKMLFDGVSDYALKYNDRWDVFELKTDESPTSPIKLKDNVKQAITKLSKYLKDDMNNNVYLEHTHDIQFNNHITKHLHLIPSEFGAAIYKGKNIIEPGDVMPTFYKSIYTWDPSGDYEREIKEIINNLFISEYKMDPAKARTATDSLIKILGKIFITNFDQLSEIDELSEKYYLSRKDIEDKYDLVTNNPSYLERLKVLNDKRGILSIHEVHRLWNIFMQHISLDDIKTQIEEEFTDKVKIEIAIEALEKR